MNSSSKSLSPLITAPRMTAFSPGQSPPEVRIPIFMGGAHFRREPVGAGIGAGIGGAAAWPGGQDEPARASRRPNSTVRSGPAQRSEEHTSELQSRGHLVCRLLRGKKKNNGT